MTHNQLAYANYLEQRRHNLESEKLGYGNLSELSRHNVQSETIGYGTLAESTRHNRQTESVNWYLAPSQSELNAQSASERKQHAKLYGVQSAQAPEQLRLQQQQVESQIWRNRFENVESVGNAARDVGIGVQSISNALPGIRNLILDRQLGLR